MDEAAKALDEVRKKETQEKLRALEQERLAEVESKRKEIEDAVNLGEELEKKKKEKKEADLVAKAEEEEKKKAEAEVARQKASEEHDIKFYSLEELKSGVDGIDPNERENYLSPAEFEDIFGMDKDSFHALKSWQQNKMKKRNAIF